MSDTKANKCQEIIEQYKNGNTQVINELPEYIDGMIYSLLKPYKLYPDRDEMYQVAWQAIMKCVEHYDPNRGTMFTTFAYPAIKRELRQYRQRIDKHNKYKVENGENVHKVLPLDAYVQVKNCGNTRYVSLSNLLVSDCHVEDSAFINELRRVILEQLNTYDNEKQKAIIADYLYGIKGKYIAYHHLMYPVLLEIFLIKLKKKLVNKVSKHLPIYIL